MNFLFFKLADEYTLPGILNYAPVRTSVYPPLGLLYIAAVLEHQGHTVRIIDLGMEPLTQDLLETSLHDVDAVGISVFSKNYQQAAVLAKTIKDIDPSLPLILGGPHCITHKEHSLTHIPTADIVVEGDGEGTMPVLVEALNGTTPLSTVPGISYRTTAGAIEHGAKATMVEDLDTLPFPARHLVAHYHYGKFPWAWKQTTQFTSMITSRGCPYRCRFCARHSNLIDGYRYRQRSAEKVVEELETLQGKYKTIAIVDDNFLQNTKRAHAIFDRILERGLDFDFRIIGARVDSAEPSLFHKMRKAGVKYINFGIESGAQAILDYYRKHITLDQIRTAVKLAAHEGMFVEATFILGAPIETPEMIKESIRFIHTIPLDNIIIRPLVYEIGDDLWYEAVNQGKIAPDEWLVNADSRRGLGYFTPNELNVFIDQAYRRFYLKPRYSLHELRQVLLFKDIDRLKNMLKLTSAIKLKDLV